MAASNFRSQKYIQKDYLVASFSLMNKTLRKVENPSKDFCGLLLFKIETKVLIKKIYDQQIIFSICDLFFKIKTNKSQVLFNLPRKKILIFFILIFWFQIVLWLHYNFQVFMSSGQLQFSPGYCVALEIRLPKKFVIFPQLLVWLIQSMIRATLKMIFYF